MTARANGRSTVFPEFGSENIGDIGMKMWSPGFADSNREGVQMIAFGSTILVDAARSGRASGKEGMARTRYQEGSLVIRGKRRRVWVIRWRESVLQTDGSVKRVQRAETLGLVKTITRQIARSALNQKLKTETHNQRWPQAVRSFSEFVQAEWKPNAALAVKKSTMKFYNFQLEKHIVPVFGSCSLGEVNRNQIESLLSKLREKGHASGTLRGVRTTISTVLQSAVERGYLDGNAAHGIRIRSMGVKPKPRFYSPAQVQKLLPELGLPCRTVVQVAVLTGMRIGEILALRWKRVDFLRKTLEVAETFSDGDFGTPKTNSSNRVLPISSSLCEVLEAHRSSQKLCGPDDLLFTTPRGTPLSSKNLYNRELAPACDRIKEPRISWHAFRHTHATLLTDVGESIKTAQA